MRVIQHRCARLYEWTIAALAKAVDCRTDVVCLQEPLRDRGGVGINHTAYEIRKRNRVWMAIRKGSGLLVEQRTGSNWGANDNVIVTDVSRSGENIPRIVNIDDRRDTQSGGSQARKLDWQKVIPERESVLQGDSNAHSGRWEPTCHRQWNATFWAEVIHENGQEIGNDGQRSQCCTREDYEGRSVIDLT